MKITMIVVRTLMGALLLFGSIVYLFKLVPVQALSGDVKTYNEGLAVVNLMFFIKIVELLCGLAFISGRFVTLAVVVIFPIVINIVLFHAVVARPSIGPALFLLFGDLFLAWYYRQRYLPLFAAK